MNPLAVILTTQTPFKHYVQIPIFSLRVINITAKGFIINRFNTNTFLLKEDLVF